MAIIASCIALCAYATDHPQSDLDNVDFATEAEERRAKTAEQRVKNAATEAKFKAQELNDEASDQRNMIIFGILSAVISIGVCCAMLMVYGMSSS